MKREEVIFKSRKKVKKGKAFVVSDKWITYRSKEAKKASFLFESGNKRYSMRAWERDEKENASDKCKMIIVPISEYCVGVNKLNLDGTEGDWFIGGLYINNDDMKILGYAEYETFNILIYFNSDTDTPFIILEDWDKTLTLKLLYQSLVSFFVEKERENDKLDF